MQRHANLTSADGMSDASGLKLARQPHDLRVVGNIMPARIHHPQGHNMRICRRVACLSDQRRKVRFSKRGAHLGGKPENPVFDRLRPEAQ